MCIRDSDIPALAAWLEKGNNYFVCDTEGALGDTTGKLLQHPNVFCAGVSAGRTKQAFDLLSQKVLCNIRTFLEEEKVGSEDKI